MKESLTSNSVVHAFEEKYTKMSAPKGNYSVLIVLLAIALFLGLLWALSSKPVVKSIKSNEARINVVGVND